MAWYHSQLIDVQKAHNAHVYKALIILDKFNV